MQISKNNFNYKSHPTNLQSQSNKLQFKIVKNLEENTSIINFIIQQLKNDFLIFSQEEYLEKYQLILDLTTLLNIKYSIEKETSLIIIKKYFNQLERELLLKEKLEIDLLQLNIDNIKDCLVFLKEKYKHANQLLLEKLFYEIISQKFN